MRNQPHRLVCWCRLETTAKTRTKTRMKRAPAGVRIRSDTLPASVLWIHMLGLYWWGKFFDVDFECRNNEIMKLSWCCLDCDATKFYFLLIWHAFLLWGYDLCGGCRTQRVMRIIDSKWLLFDLLVLKYRIKMLFVFIKEEWACNVLHRYKFTWLPVNSGKGHVPMYMLPYSQWITTTFFCSMLQVLMGCSHDNDPCNICMWCLIL